MFNLFSPQQQIRSQFKRKTGGDINEEEIKPHKIAAIKKHIYDRNGQVTEKGRIILKELGVKSEDLQEQPIDQFKRSQKEDPTSSCRYEFNQNKRFSRLMKLQQNLYPFANSQTNTIHRGEKGTGVHIADGGKFTKSMATLFNKKVALPAKKFLPLQYSTGFQSPSNDQSLSMNNGTTFFTEINNLVSPKQHGRVRPGTAGASRSIQVKLSRTTTEPFNDDLNISQMSTTNKTNMTRPMSISLRMQEDKDLKWMKVQETSLTRSEKRDQEFRSKVVQYDGRIKKYEKRVKEQTSDLKEEQQVAQQKRDMHLHYKQDVFKERDAVAYQSYIDDQKQRKVSTPLLNTRGFISRTDLKSSQSQGNLRTLNKSLSASSIKSATSQGQFQNRTQINKEIDLQLDTIKERLKKSHVRRQTVQNEIQQKCKQHNQKLDKSLALHSTYLMEQSKSLLQTYVQGRQKRNQNSVKSTTQLLDKVEFRKQKNTDKRERSQSTRAYLNSNRDEKLNKIVTKYHEKIDEQVQDRISTVKLGTLRKKAIDQEWGFVHHDNNGLIIEKKRDMNDMILQKQRIIERSNQRMNQLLEFKQDLSIQSNFARRVHKKMIIDQLQKEKHLHFFKNYGGEPVVLKNRPRDFRKQLGGTQGFSIQSIISPKKVRQGEDLQEKHVSYHH